MSTYLQHFLVDVAAQDLSTHTAFADESSHTDGRYRALGLVTLESSLLPEMKKKLHQIISVSGISEVKWAKLRTTKDQRITQKLLAFAVEQAKCKALRFDIVIWDTYDERHTIVSRDDRENLHRMYFHLLINVMGNRWSGKNTWLLYPDHNTAMKWKELRDWLERKRFTTDSTKNLFKPWMSSDLERKFRIQSIYPCDSRQEPFIQLIDLMVGLAVYSRTEYNKYQEWATDHLGQLSLFGSPDSVNDLTKSQKVRFPVLYEFNLLCKRFEIGVRLTKSRGLRTYQPENPINFWWYTPQHPNDKAPTKKK